jgi:hypothetical protein
VPAHEIKVANDQRQKGAKKATFIAWRLATSTKTTVARQGSREERQQGNGPQRTNGSMMGAFATLAFAA